MLNRKKKKITVPTVETTQITVPTLHGVKQAVVPAVAGAAVAAKHWGDEQAHAAGDWAKPHLEQGRENAKAAAEALSERSDEARSKLGETGPKLSSAVTGLLAAGAATRDDTKDRAQHAVKDWKSDATSLKKQAREQAKGQAKRVKSKVGTSKPEKKKGSLLGNLVAALGVVVAAAAIATLFAKKQNEPKDDPWARPLTDPYIPSTNGANTTGTVGAGTGPATTEPAATVGAATTGAATPLIPAVNDIPVAGVDTTPPAKLGDSDVVDLTAGGLPPQSDVEARDTNGTLGEALENDNKGHN